MGYETEDIVRQVRQGVYRQTLQAMPATLALSIQFRRLQGRWPDLLHPKTFNEKLQWRKLYDRNPLWPTLVDKVAVKALLKRNGARDWLIPTIWTGSHLTAAALGRLSPPYVIKPNNSSGRIVINRDPGADLEALATRANAMIRTPHPRFLCEWPNTQVRPLLMIEPLLGGGPRLPTDYKFYAFHGRVQFIQVDLNRETHHRRILYGRDWRRTPFQYRLATAEEDVAPPSQLASMTAFAERIGAELGLDFVRVDLYEAGGCGYFGELTAFPSSGFAKFDPLDADLAIGALWTLPERPWQAKVTSSTMA